MDRIAAMRHFLAVVEGGSFSNAARRLGVANATITQSVQNLEAHLGVRLINRTTRQMKLTFEGSTYAERCRDILNDLEGLEAEIVGSVNDVAGELRVEIPSAIGRRHFVPRLLEFSREHPNLRTTVFLNPSASCMVEDGIDAGIQLGELASSSLIARRVHTARHVACAWPVFRGAAGRPAAPDEIREADCLNFLMPKTARPQKWIFEKGDRHVEFSPSGALSFNSSDALIEVARRGGGIAYTPTILVGDFLKSGELVDLFPGWRTRERGVYVVFHNRRNVPAKVRAFTSFAERVFAEF